MEVLLSYIEFSQYQQHIIKLYPDNDKLEVDKVQFMDFPENMPISAIIESESDLAVTTDIDIDIGLYNLKLKASKLFNRYIETGTSLEINISSTLRKDLTNLLQNKELLLNKYNLDANDLLQVFEECKVIQIEYLNFSLIRFKQQPDFQGILQVFDNIEP